MIPHEA